MIVYDHDHPAWSESYRRHGRTNGAYTYSRDICRWHLPVWRALLGSRDAVATCGKMPGATVQYLHERSHPVLSDDTMLFVTTYKDLADALGKRGLWIPNTVDASSLPRHQPAKDWVYYGNLVGEKRKALAGLQGLRFDIVSCVGSQSGALSRVSRYRYGIGVGRCAIEMMAMGLKVLIYGKSFGGLILSGQDFEAQRQANFNSNVVTGVGSIADGVERIDQALPAVPTFQHDMAEIEQRIVEGWRRAVSA